MRILENPALTFDDVLLVPQYSDVLPRDVETRTTLAGWSLQIPFLSAAMDTVTEYPMAIQMARQGGLGIVHKNMPAAAQAWQIQQVKQQQTMDGAATRDPAGRLRVGAAVGTGHDTGSRIEQLVAAEVDVLVLDTAHADSHGVCDRLRWITRHFSHIPVIAGNITTYDAACRLIDAGAKGVKVGIGPGSICTTRIVAGVGVPQITAIIDVARATRGSGVSLVADGGIRYSGDVVKALAAGADAVMVGGLLAGTEESPGDQEWLEGRAYKAYRGMGSLGAMAAGSRDRYFQEGTSAPEKWVPEGIEGRVPYKGPVAPILHQLVGGLRAGMGYIGAADLEQLYEKACFVRISPAGMRESHVHDVMMATIPPNYVPSEGVR